MSAGTLNADRFADVVRDLVKRADRDKTASPVLPRLLCELAARLSPGHVALAIAATEEACGLLDPARRDRRVAELRVELFWTPVTVTEGQP